MAVDPTSEWNGTFQGLAYFEDHNDREYIRSSFRDPFAEELPTVLLSRSRGRAEEALEHGARLLFKSGGDSLLFPRGGVTLGRVGGKWEARQVSRRDCPPAPPETTAGAAHCLSGAWRRATRLSPPNRRSPARRPPPSGPRALAQPGGRFLLARTGDQRNCICIQIRNIHFYCLFGDLFKPTGKCSAQKPPHDNSRIRGLSKSTKTTFSGNKNQKIIPMKHGIKNPTNAPKMTAMKL